MQPLAIELYCGSFGWSEGWLSLGGRAIGFDIEHLPHHGPVPEGASLVLQDVTTLHGSQFKDASLILASPPCQEFSYSAMPWKRAKAQVPDVLPDWWEKPESKMSREELREWKLWRTEHPAKPPSTILFDACFRIQREACEAAGRYIPMVVENVRGAQPWVGRAKANFGSYYLWGDVGMVGKRVVAGVPRFGVSVQPMKAAKVPGFRFDGVSHGSFQSASVAATKVPGLDNGCWPPGGLAQGFLDAQKRNPDGTDHGSGSWFKIADSKNRGAHSKVPGISFNGESGATSPGFNVTAAQRYREEAAQRVDESGTKGGGDWFGSGEDCSLQRRFSGTKQSGISGERNNGKGDRWFQDGAAKHGSKSNSRKAASAAIARIPFALSLYIAHAFKHE